MFVMHIRFAERLSDTNHGNPLRVRLFDGNTVQVPVAMNTYVLIATIVRTKNVTFSDVVK